MLATLKASFADVFGRKTAWRCDGGPCGLLRAVRQDGCEAVCVLPGTMPLWMWDRDTASQRRKFARAEEQMAAAAEQSEQVRVRAITATRCWA